LRLGVEPGADRGAALGELVEPRQHRFDPGDPGFGGSPLPTQVLVTPTPGPVSPSPSGPGGTPTASGQPTSGPSGVPSDTGDALPTRIVIPSLDIDLPIVSGDTSYPLCNVAQYLRGFANPGQPGTTYLYGHARDGMFLPLLTESEKNDGAALIGALVKVYTADQRLHLYQINIVKRHATDLSLAFDLAPGEHRLIMQTSEGPHGTVPKLQVAAKPLGVYVASAADALPTPHPVDCGS